MKAKANEIMLTPSILTNLHLARTRPIKLVTRRSHLFLLEPILDLGKDVGYEFGDFFIGGH